MTVGWTERHTWVAAAFAIGFAGATAGIAEAEPVMFWVAGAVALAAIASLAVDAYGGIVIGLAVAAGLIAAKRLAGRWEPDAFTLSLAETLALVAVGASAGLAGSALRRRAASGLEDAPAAVNPVFGSLGLLDHDVAMARLEEEYERARDHRRPLALLLLDTEIVDASLEAAEREAVLRAVARVLESRLHPRDVPFAEGPGRLGAILPEASVEDGWERLGHVLDALAEAGFTSRRTGTRRVLADAVDIRIGLAERGPATPSAQALLEAAAGGLDRDGRAVEELRP